MSTRAKKRLVDQSIVRNKRKVFHPLKNQSDKNNTQTVSLTIWGLMATYRYKKSARRRSL
jgi:hypothetical protein